MSPNLPSNPTLAPSKLQLVLGAPLGDTCARAF